MPIDKTIFFRENFKIYEKAKGAIENNVSKFEVVLVLYHFE